MEEALEKIKAFAAEAHGDQKRKFSGAPYVNHLVNVMEICREATDDISMLAAALLHDVLEDTEVPKEAMEQFLTEVLGRKTALRTIGLVEELTDVYVKKDFPKWNRRKRKDREEDRISTTSADSQTIKYADIIDNCRSIPIEEDFARTFLLETRSLLRKIRKGNPDLYQRAVKTVNEQLEKGFTIYE